MENHELSLPAPAPVAPVAQVAPGAYPSHAPAPQAGANPFGEARPLGEDDGRAHPVRHLRKRVSSILAAIGAAIAKFFAAIKGFVLLLPKLKLLTTSGTALVSVAAYSLFWGWVFAAGFVLLMFVHEMGHVIALRREGIKASTPMFIPFLGAAIFSKSLGENALAEARVGLAGPILGSLAAAAVAIVGAIVGSSFLLALAYVGFLYGRNRVIRLFGTTGSRKYSASPTRMKPNRCSTHASHSPDRGRRRICPAAIASPMYGTPRPSASVKNSAKPNSALPLRSTISSRPSTIGPMHGAATTPMPRPISSAPAYPGCAAPARWSIHCGLSFFWCSAR